MAPKLSTIIVDGTLEGFDEVRLTGVSDEDLLVRMRLQDGTTRLVELRNGTTVDCDTVIFATGIQPNVELARYAGIRVARGIVVDDTLATSHPDVFAVGECVEHRNEIYGLLAPGLEQAAILADRFCRGSAAGRPGRSVVGPR